MEYVEIPSDLVVRLEGRSNWARRGLQVHGAVGFVDPGFHGVITFELSNISRLPIELYPTLRIAQLTFQELSANALLDYGSKDRIKYQHALRPGYSRN